MQPPTDRVHTLWEAASALPAFDMMGTSPPLIALRRIYEHWRPNGERSFSIYSTAAGVLALISLPATSSFRIHYATHDHPAAAALLALLEDTGQPV